MPNQIKALKLYAPLDTVKEGLPQILRRKEGENASLAPYNSEVLAMDMDLTLNDIIGKSSAEDTLVTSVSNRGGGESNNG